MMTGSAVDLVGALMNGGSFEEPCRFSCGSWGSCGWVTVHVRLRFMSVPGSRVVSKRREEEQREAGSGKRERELDRSSNDQCDELDTAGRRDRGGAGPWRRAWCGRGRRRRRTGRAFAGRTGRAICRDRRPAADVRARGERDLEDRAAVRALVTHPDRRSHLSHRRAQQPAGDDRARSARAARFCGSVRAPRPRTEKLDTRNGPAGPSPAVDGTRHLRLLRRLRGHLLRPGRPGALARAARPVQQPLRHGRVAGAGRRSGHPGLRPEHQLLHRRARQDERGGALEDGAARGAQRPLDADPLSAEERRDRRSWRPARSC